MEVNLDEIDHEKGNEDHIVEARHRMLITLKGLYWEKFEVGQCSSESVLLLTESIDRAIDHETMVCKDVMFF